jgi:exodeoxyribonuclease VII small subunit
MARQKQAAPVPPEKLTFEQAIDELERIIEAIEQGEIGLEEALAQRKRGEGLIRRCRAILDTAEQELKHITPEGPGPPGQPEAAESTDGRVARE